MLRRLVGPLTLFEPAPDYIKWKAAPTVELLDGLATLDGTSPSTPSWNQLVQFLKAMAELRAQGGFAA
jgi:hypothetical protein